MASVTILGRKCDLLLLAASAALVLFIVSVTMGNCKGCSGSCSKNKGNVGCDCNGTGCSNCSKEPAPAGNITGADDGTFSNLADV
jgi:hypothetical protein